MTSEAQLQAQVIELANLLHIKHYHTFDSRRSVDGWPDLVLVGAGMIIRELKTEKGVESVEQKRWMAALRYAGLDVDVWRPSDWASGRISREMRALGRSPYAGVAPETAQKRARAKLARRETRRP